jgi:hypothetical protein
MVTIQRLIGVSKTSHTTHDTENVVVGGIDTNLGSLGALNGGVGENELKGSIVNAGEVTGPAWLMFLRPQSKGVNIDTGVRSVSVVLVRLDKVEVSTFTLRETILAVKLEFSGDNRVLTPAVKRERSLSEDESAGIRDSRLEGAVLVKIRFTVGSGTKCGVGATTPPVSTGNISGTSIIKETRTVNKGAGSCSNRIHSTKCMDSIGKGINRVSIVKRLSTKNPV